MCILAFLIKNVMTLIPLIVMLFVLLVPYCMHYYFLENSVQRMYVIYFPSSDEEIEDNFSHETEHVDGRVRTSYYCVTMHLI
jgi:hypothetical protein